MVASIVHLKITHHYERGVLVTVKEDLPETMRIRKVICEDIQTPASKNSVVREGEIILTPIDEFEFVQLGDNLVRPTNIDIGLSHKVRSMLIECIQEKADVFAISPHEMYDIDPRVACH